MVGNVEVLKQLCNEEAGGGSIAIHAGTSCSGGGCMKQEDACTLAEDNADAALDLAEAKALFLPCFCSARYSWMISSTPGISSVSTQDPSSRA